MPADLAAVQADDALLDMLGTGDRVPGDNDDELTRLITAWRREIHTDSDRVLVDTNTALAVINAARRPARRRNPVFGTAAAAAAALVIAFSAVGLAAKAAQPGDQMWGVTQVLYADYARSVEAAAVVRDELVEAKTAIDQGRPEQARKALQKIQQQLPVIAENEGKTDLATQHNALEKQVEKAAPAEPDKSRGLSESDSTARTSTSAPAITPTSTPTPTPSPAEATSPTGTPTATPSETASSTKAADPTDPTSTGSQPLQPPMAGSSTSGNFSGPPYGYPYGHPYGPDWRPYPNPNGVPGGPGSGPYSPPGR